MQKKVEKVVKNIVSASSDSVLSEFSQFIKGFKQKHALTDYDLIDLILDKKVESKDFVPVDIFIRDLGCLEAMVKFLKENKNLSFKKIAELTNRSSASIANSYSKAKHKFLSTLSPNSNLQIPLYIFTNKKLSILENLVSYLKDEKNLRLREIAKLIDRNEKTVWTVYNRGKNK